MTVPSVFGLPHLSEDAVASFADGVLSPPAAARARRHCAECTECADAVRGQREAAMMLRTAGAPALPAGLLDRLAGLPMSAELPTRPSGLPTTLGADGVPMFVAYRAPGKDQSAGPAERSALQTAELPGLTGRAGAQPEPRAAHRRALFPISILASAAAVVAAGAIGSTATSGQPTLEQPASVNLLGGTGATEFARPASGDTLAVAVNFDPSTSWLVQQANGRSAAASPRTRPNP